MCGFPLISILEAKMLCNRVKIFRRKHTSVFNLIFSLNCEIRVMRQFSLWWYEAAMSQDFCDDQSRGRNTVNKMLSLCKPVVKATDCPCFFNYKNMSATRDEMSPLHCTALSGKVTFIRHFTWITHFSQEKNFQACHDQQEYLSYYTS